MMSEESLCRYQIPVVGKDGRVHVADFSDMAVYRVDEESIRSAIDAILDRRGMRRASPLEQERHGFLNKEPRLDRYPRVTPRSLSGRWIR